MNRTLGAALLALAGALTAAPPAKIAWTTSTDRGFDLARSGNRSIVQLFTKPRCTDCQKLEREIARDTALAGLIERGFIAIRSDAATPDGRSEAENAGVETWPTVLFFTPRGKPILAATLEAPFPIDTLRERLAAIAEGRFAPAAVPAAPTSAVPASSGGWSLPDTSRQIVAPPVPDTLNAATDSVTAAPAP